MCKAALVAAGLLSGLALAVAAAAADSSGPNANCHPGVEGHPGSCVDSIGDVKGAAGPDIARVTEYEWGVIAFRVTFAKAGRAGSPLAYSATFSDEVSVMLMARGKTTRRYLLSISATDLKHQVLQRLPNGKRLTLPAPPGATAMTSKYLTLAVNLHALGDPSIVRYRIEAARVMLDGTPGSSDYIPDNGTIVWHAWNSGA